MATDDLASHHIRQVKTFQIEYRYPRLVGKNARLGIHGRDHTAQVRFIATDKGAEGWGLSREPEETVPDLTGRSIAELFDPAMGVITPEAIYLDFPLHDLVGAILDQPVYKLLGFHGNTTVSCYDGAIYMDDLLPEEKPRDVEAVLENCRHDYALGYRAFKLKIGRGHRWMDTEAGLQRDIEITHLVRRYFPDCAILVDANDGYSCEGFLRYLDAVAECGIFWVEEPFPENRRDLLHLRDFIAKRSPATLVADGESSPDIPFLLSLAQEKLIDVLIMDIVGLGFTAWRQWMPIFMQSGIRTAPHAWGNPMKTFYTAQLAAGLGNVLTVEGVPGASADVDWNGYKLTEGLLHVPSDSGFGMYLRRAWAKPHFERRQTETLGEKQAARRRTE